MGEVPKVFSNDKIFSNPKPVKMKLTILILSLLLLVSCKKELPNCGCDKIQNAKQKAICQINCR